MRKTLLSSLIGVIVITVLFGLVYPLVMTGVSQVVFPGEANGSKVSLNGKVVGSSLIAQSFSRPLIGKNGKPKLDEEGEEILVPDKRYFQPRPSATGYSGDVTFFGNAGPNSVEEREAVRENLASYVALEKPYDHSLTREGVPVDAVTFSASGVDPEISQANAWIQAHRIAAVRQLPLTKVDELISDHTHGRFLGVLGEPGVNVLQLNIALDKEAPIR
jgi:potassium-transporting ATPase KdpC subunit